MPLIFCSEIFSFGEHHHVAIVDSECFQNRLEDQYAVHDVTLAPVAAVVIAEVCLCPNGLADFTPLDSILVVPFEFVPFNVKCPNPGPGQNASPERGGTRRESRGDRAPILLVLQLRFFVLLCPSGDRESRPAGGRTRTC